MKHCPKCNRAFADPSMRFCLEDGEVLVDAAASLSHDSQATLVLPEAKASRPSRFSFTQEGRSTIQHPVTPDFSQRRQSGQHPPVIHRRNSTAWIVVLLVILGLVGITGYFLLRSLESDGSRNTQTVTTTSQTPSSTPPMSATPQREASVAVDKQTNPAAGPTEPPVESSTREADKPKTEMGNDSQAKTSPTGTTSADESNRAGEDNRRKAGPENDIGKSRGNGFFEITIENAWVSAKSGSFEFCGYRVFDEQKAVFVRFTIRALSDSLPNTRTEDFIIIDSGRRIDTTCGDGRFYPQSFTGEKQKTITLVYTVRRESKRLTFRFQRVGYGDAIAFDLSGLG